MMNFIKNFHNDEDGAVTVDWVVLTAAIVGLGIAAISTVNDGVDAMATSIETDLTGTGTGAAGLDGTDTLGGS